jgi:hypothetical protein
MSSQTRTLYPSGPIGAPKHRQGHATEFNTGLPAGTEVFSADNHISVADDIFYEQFPDDLKDRAPRIWYEDGAYLLGPPGNSMVVGDFSAVLMQYDDLAGAATNNIEARIPTRTCANGFSASTTNTSPTCRNVPTGTATESV